MTLQRQVSSLASRQRQQFQYTKFDMPLSTLDLLPPVVRASEDSDAFDVIHLMKPNLWQEIFSSNAQSTAPKRATVTNVRIEAYFTPKNSLTPMTQKWVTVWLVSLHKEAAAQCLENTDGLETTAADNGLNASAQGEFYFTRNSNGPFSSMPLLNPKVFKIHAHRNFNMANIMQEEMSASIEAPDVAAISLSEVTKRVLINQRLNTTIETQTGSAANFQTWKDLSADNLEQTDRLYLITHVGGYADDGDNGVNIAPHVTFTVKTLL